MAMDCVVDVVSKGRGPDYKVGVACDTHGWVMGVRIAYKHDAIQIAMAHKMGIGFVHDDNNE